MKATSDFCAGLMALARSLEVLAEQGHCTTSDLDPDEITTLANAVGYADMLNDYEARVGADVSEARAYLDRYHEVMRGDFVST